MKKDLSLPPGFAIYDNVVENSQYFIDLALIQEGWQDLTKTKDVVKDGVLSSGKGEERKNRRVCKNLIMRTSEKYPSDWQYLRQIICSYAKLYALDNEIPMPNDIDYLLETLQMVHYKQGEGIFTTHIDDCPKFPRHFSVLFYLNDVEKGGEVYFPNFDYLLTPKAGRIAFFPSIYPYKHDARMPVSSDKFVIISWFKQYTVDFVPPVEL
jgi:hypothetical protein